VTHTGCLLATSGNEIGKIGPARRVAAKILPYFILALDGGPATAFALGPRLAEFSLATPSVRVV
jgi:hypothetical protein